MKKSSQAESLVRRLLWKGRIMKVTVITIGGSTYLTARGAATIIDDPLSVVVVGVIAFVFPLVAWNVLYDRAERREGGEITRAVCLLTAATVAVLSSWYGWQSLGMRPSHEYHQVKVIDQLRDDLRRTRRAVANEAKVAPLLEDAGGRLSRIVGREAKTGKGPIFEAKKQQQEKYQSAARALRENQKTSQDALHQVERGINALQSIQVETQGNRAVDIRESNRDFARKLMAIDGAFSTLSVSKLDAVMRIVESDTSQVAPKGESLTDSQERENAQLLRVGQSLRKNILTVSADPVRPKVSHQRVLSDQEALFTYVLPLIQHLIVPLTADLAIPALGFVVLWALGRRRESEEEEEASADVEPATSKTRSDSAKKGGQHDNSMESNVSPLFAAIRAAKTRH